MSRSRSLSWSAALRDMRADRAPVAPGWFAAAQAAKIEALRAKAGACLWTPDGGFDCRAIMAKAVANARCERGTWSERMSEALTYAWACAHAARRAGSH